MTQANGKQAGKKKPGAATKRAGYHHGALRQALLEATEALLREEGVVRIRGEAQTRFYSLSDPAISAIIHALCDICQSLSED